MTKHHNNTDDKPAGRLISLADAAAHVGVHRATIRRWIADGTLVGYSPHGRTQGIRVDIADLNALYRPIPSAKTV